MIEARLPVGSSRVVLHWFSGSAAEARRAAEMGCYFSINAEMLRSDRSAKIVDSLPRGRILTETDGPFARGESSGGTPANVRPARDGLANLYNMEHDEVDLLLNENLRKLLS